MKKILILLLLILIGCSNNNVPSGSTDPKRLERSPTVEVLATSPAPVDDSKGGINMAYNLLISEWESAFSYFASEDDTKNSLLSFSFYDMSVANSVKAYYALNDIDGNGIMELILRKTNGYEDIIAYIFTMKGDKAINIFGNDSQNNLHEVPWSRVGSCDILSNGLIDCSNGDFAIYRITNDGYGIVRIAYSEPYDYPDMARLADAKWRYYINDVQVDYDFYVRHLNEQGYIVDGNNTLAEIDWVALDYHVYK